jgi:pantoate--beta-alanine ligase
MKILRTVSAVRQTLAPLRAEGPVALVPTMGALHDGHAALFRAARITSQTVVASVFVNPRQFTDPADLARYPRQEADDVKLTEAMGVDIFFAPPVEEMYPTDFSLSVEVSGPSVGLEERARPGHFRGVATVCLKLFSIVSPTDVFLGQKDAQQVAVLRQLVRDANLDLAIRVVATVRDRDGLALSSRNVALSADDRRQAMAIPAALMAGVAAHARGEDPVRAAEASLGALPVDYITIATFDGRPTLALAVTVGRTRLIDNVPLDEPGLAGLPSVPETADVPEARHA